MGKLLSFFTTLNKKDFKEAFIELIISLIVSTMPIWGLYIAMSIDKSIFFDLDRFYSIVKNGELFIYSATMLAPILYLLIKKREHEKEFYAKPFFIIFVVVITVIATITISMQRMRQVIISDSAVIGSLWLFGISIFILYVALVIHNSLMPDPTAVMRDGEKSFLDQVMSRRS